MQFYFNKAHDPKVIVHPSDTSAGAPFSAVFTCSATGYGKLLIEWKRSDNFNLPVKSYSTQITTQQFITSTFVIPNVTYDDSGEYYCIGWIGMQASKSKTALLHYSGQLQKIYVVVYICTA